MSRSYQSKLRSARGWNVHNLKIDEGLSYSTNERIIHCCRRSSEASYTGRPVVMAELDALDHVAKDWHEKPTCKRQLEG